MNIVLGASGQVGSAIVEHLVSAGQPVRGVVHNANKAEELKKLGAEVAVADALDRAALGAVLQGGTTVFVLTPESGHAQDVIGETKALLANYKATVAASSIRKLVGLSSIGAQHATHSGNLQMSALLEHAFEGLAAQQIFVRPAYFYSNWLPLVDTAQSQGILPTFYPTDLQIPMVSPLDVAALVADLMCQNIEGNPIYEVEGLQWYSSDDVAAALSETLGRNVAAHQTPRDQWPATLHQMGYTPDATRNFIEMTDLLVAGKALPQGQGTTTVKTPTTLAEYLTAHIER